MRLLGIDPLEMMSWREKALEGEWAALFESARVNLAMNVCRCCCGIVYCSAACLTYLNFSNIMINEPILIVPLAGNLKKTNFSAPKHWGGVE